MGSHFNSISVPLQYTPLTYIIEMRLHNQHGSSFCERDNVQKHFNGNGGKQAGDKVLSAVSVTGSLDEH